MGEYSSAVVWMISYSIFKSLNSLFLSLSELAMDGYLHETIFDFFSLFIDVYRYPWNGVRQCRRGGGRDLHRDASLQFRPTPAVHLR